MKRHAGTILLLPLLLSGLFSCTPQAEDPAVANLDFGTLIGTSQNDEVNPRSQVKWIKSSRLATLVKQKSSFILLLHGSSDTCSCYVGWHANIAAYAKAHNALIYGIDLDELESGTEYYGLQRVASYDTLAVFKDGAVLHQQTTEDQSDPFAHDYATLSDWLRKRTNDAKIYYVNEALLDAYYQGSRAFTVYFGRDNCGDCAYLSTTGLRDYLNSHERVDDCFFYIDFDAYRPTANPTEEPDLYQEQSSAYAEKKAKYGLEESEGNPMGFDYGVFPTVYHINPDGYSFKGDVIEAAGVFYNERVDRTSGEVSEIYFSKQRYESAKGSYLQYLGPEGANLEKPYMENLVLDPSKDRHEQLKPYETPFFNALLDYAVKA